jgi:DDE family transposase
LGDGGLRQDVTCMVHDLSDRSAVVFDGQRVVVNAGLMLAVTLGRRLGLEALVDAAVKLGARPGASRPGRKVLSLVHAMLLGADCIDDCEILRAGRTEAILGHKAMAPSTLGTFALVHVRARAPTRPRPGPDAATRVAGGRRAGRAAAGDRRRQLRRRGPRPRQAGRGLRLHPKARLPPAAGHQGRHQRGTLRKGQANTQRGALRCVDELLARVRNGGRDRRALLRADSGFWNKKVIARLCERGCRSSIGVTMQKIVAARIAEIPDNAWQPVTDYPDSGICELAETTLGDDRLIVRRVHLHAPDEQTELFTYWQHFAFITNRAEPVHEVDAEHRQQAQVELVIRDLKDQALAHFPSGHYSANSPWTVIACLAHNLARWTALIGLSDRTPRAAATIRRRLFALPGRLTHSARRQTLHLHARWPWQTDFIQALTRIRALPAAA